MNLEEYWSQNPVKKLAPFSVYVHPSEYYHLYDVHKGRIVDLLFKGQHYTYLIPDDCPNGEMYVIDGDGNKRKASVFKLVAEDYHQRPKQ